MNNRWDALDVLRGLTIIAMLLNLCHLAAIYVVLRVCHRKRWIFKL